MSTRLILTLSLAALGVLLAAWLYWRSIGPEPSGPQAAGINDMGGPSPLDAKKSSELESSSKVWEGSAVAPDGAVADPVSGGN